MLLLVALIHWFLANIQIVWLSYFTNTFVNAKLCHVLTIAVLRYPVFQQNRLFQCRLAQQHLAQAPLSRARPLASAYPRVQLPRSLALLAFLQLCRLHLSSRLHLRVRPALGCRLPRQERLMMVSLPWAVREVLRRRHGSKDMPRNISTLRLFHLVVRPADPRVRRRR